MKLNIGCGTDIRHGWVNMDAGVDHPNVAKHDITNTPWPFPDNHFDHILASHVMEHVPTIFRPQPDGTHRDVLFDIIEEAYRVLKPGGTWEILVPVAWSHSDTTHPQHYRRYVPNTFVYFTRHPNVYEDWLHKAEFDLIRAVYRYSPLAWRNPPILQDWRIRNICVFDHVRIRLPFLRPLVTRKGEIQAILRKPPGGRSTTIDYKGGHNTGLIRPGWPNTGDTTRSVT